MVGIFIAEFIVSCRDGRTCRHLAYHRLSIDFASTSTAKQIIIFTNILSTLLLINKKKDHHLNLPIITMKLSVFSIIPIAIVGVSIITLQSEPANALRQQVYRRGAIAAEDDQRALEDLSNDLSMSTPALEDLSNDLSMSIQDVELNVAPQFNAARGGV